MVIVMSKMRNLKVVGAAVATLGLAATLVTGGAATASPSTEKPDAGSHVELRAATAAVPCWTSVEQPNGTGTTIYVTYNNCGTTNAKVTPASSAVNNSGTFTYVGWCATITPGTAGAWAITPDWFPSTPTNRYTVTNCL
ncbi:hypothetical protein FHX34_108162 [Actinoplanes teichomyceticus]|uniref:Secreted protein n=2 Tax=Actinoplanes teichomyceticus TaxID=1867 RepID=A0A561VCW9_ACTTI|nr:hypothetical protein FHX34_108162 [Actinoplanes teichomyceticus]